MPQLPDIPDPTPENSAMRDFWLVVLRGLIGRCPHCGKGRLLRRYLKPVEQCSSCAEPYGHIRAEDGPAWLTIVIVGHILGAILLVVIPDSSWPAWVSMAVWMLLALFLALIILPRAKGIFIGLIWRSGSIGSER